MSLRFICLSKGHSDSKTDLYYLGELQVDHPSFVEIINLAPESDENEYPDLVVTHFQEVGAGGINAFYNIGKELENIANRNPPTRSMVYDKSLTWPNYVYVAPDGIFDAQKTLIVHDGTYNALCTYKLKKPMVVKY